MWGQIPTDWIGVPREDVGWEGASCNQTFPGQTWKICFTNITNIINFSGTNTEVSHPQGVALITLNVFGVLNSSKFSRM